MSRTYEPSQDERTIARTGVMIQAEAHGIDVNDPKIKAFLEHTIEVDACNHAAIRFYTNALNKGVAK